MLRQAWILIAAGAIVAGLIAQNAAVVAVGVLVGLAGWGAQTWANWSLRRLIYERHAPEDRAFAGEDVSLWLRMSNRKPLPLPWIEARERFPQAMISEPGDEFLSTGQVSLMQTDWRTSLWSHQRASRRYDLHCPDRGVYEIGPGRLLSGDPFGLFTDEREEAHRTRIIVYPHTVELGAAALPARRPYGELTGGLKIFEDPTRVAGVRDYRPGDTLRRVDWNATARLGKLQSRVYDPSAALHLLICLNTQTTIPMWAGVVPQLLERSITVAASMAREAYDSRYSVGLLANSSFPESDRAIRIAPGRRAEQFIRILESLAIVTPFVIEPLAATLDREEHRLVLGTTIACVTGIMPPELAATLLRLRRRGHTVIVLSTSGDLWEDQLGEIEVRDLSYIDLPWRGHDSEWTPGVAR
jgi:uncharacterized protein (DUF58 family)